MKINIPFHCLACLLAILSFISCNHSSLGQYNMDNNEQNISCSSSKNQAGTFTQSVFECSNKFINDFGSKIMDDITKLIPLNPQDDDSLNKNKNLARQLYHVLSSSYLNCLLTQDKLDKPLESKWNWNCDCTWETYIVLSNKFRKKINPDFMARYVVPEQYCKDNFQHPYDIQPSNDTKPMEKLGKILFDSIKNQIIVEITDVQNRSDKNRINRLEAHPDLNLDYKKIVKQAKKAIEKIINLRFENNKKCLKEDIIIMLKNYMKQTNLLKSSLTPNEASICECLGNYFLRLRVKYYDCIQSKGKELLDFITKEIQSLIEKGAVQPKGNTCFSFMKKKLHFL